MLYILKHIKKDMKNYPLPQALFIVFYMRRSKPLFLKILFKNIKILKYGKAK